MTTVTQTLYCIQATVNGRQVPTFYLDAQVQGIISIKHAERVARKILIASIETEMMQGNVTIGNGIHANDNLHIAAMEINYEIQPWVDNAPQTL